MTSLFLTIPPFQNGNVHPMPGPLGILEGGNLFSGLPACKQAFTKAPALSLGFWSAQGLLYLDRERLSSHLHSQGPLAPAWP